jgi:hypothetical protein
MHESFNSASQVNPNANIVLNNDGAHMKFPDLSKIYNSQNEIIYEAVRLEKHTYLLVMKNLMGLLFVSEELKNFVRNNFRSIEDIRYKKSQLAMWTGITLAFIFGLCGMLKPAKLPLDRSLRLDQGQFDTLIYQNKYLNQEIKSILDIYRSDTLIAPKKIKR